MLQEDFNFIARCTDHKCFRKLESSTRQHPKPRRPYKAPLIGMYRYPPAGYLPGRMLERRLTCNHDLQLPCAYSILKSWASLDATQNAPLIFLKSQTTDRHCLLLSSHFISIVIASCVLYFKFKTAGGNNPIFSIFFHRR